MHYRSPSPHSCDRILKFGECRRLDQVIGVVLESSDSLIWPLNPLFTRLITFLRRYIGAAQFLMQNDDFQPRQGGQAHSTGGGMYSFIITSKLEHHLLSYLCLQYNWRVYAASLAISMGLLTYGYDSAFIGTTITQKSFMRDFGLSTMTKGQQDAVSSNLTSICKAFYL